MTDHKRCRCCTGTTITGHALERTVMQHLDEWDRRHAKDALFGLVQPDIVGIVFGSRCLGLCIHCWDVLPGLIAAQHFFNPPHAKETA